MNYRPGNLALFFYLLLTYIVPAAMNWATKYESPAYVNPESGVLSWIYVALLFSIVLSFAFVPAEPRLNTLNARFGLECSERLPVKSLATILLILLVVATIGAASGLSRWRYLDEGLSTSLSPTTLLYVLTPNFLEVLLFVLIFFRDATPVLHRRFLLLLVAVCMALTASGIGPAITALLAFIAFAAPNQLRNTLFSVNSAVDTRIRSPSMWRYVFFGCVCVVFVSIAYVVGDSIKTGLELFTLIENLRESSFDTFINYLIGRLSVNWYSLVAALHYFVDSDLKGQIDNLLSPITNAWFRISALTGGFLEVERPLDGSIGRINYTLINLYPNNYREGTSPGLLASFIITFPVWLAPIALTFYLSMYHAIQKRLRRRMQGHPTWVGEVVILYLTSVFFASPVDFLQIFDPMLFSFFAWIYLGYGQIFVKK